MEIRSIESFTVTLYIAGDFATAKDEIRQECMREGLCVTITPTTFVYTAGAEEGVVIGFVNYPRFPKNSITILNRAIDLGKKLMTRLYQNTCLIVSPEETIWLNLDKNK